MSTQGERPRAMAKRHVPVRDCASVSRLPACWSIGLWCLLAFAPVVRAGEATVDSDSVNAHLNLASSQVVTLDLGFSATASDGLIATVPVDGAESTITLRPHSVRAAGYVVQAQLGDGTYVELEPTPERTYRGSVDGIEGSVVAASLTDDGVRMRIIMPDDSERWIEPARGVVAGAAANQYVYYTDADVLDTERSCAIVDGGENKKAEHHHHDLRAHTHDIEHAVASVAGVQGPFITELAIDADFEYFLRYGSVGAVEDQINSIINTVNVQYERDLNIRHVITTIIVRTAEPDPYSSSDAATLLNQFRNHWVVSQGAVQRDMAQLFTGRALNNTVIGVAWRGESGTQTVCGSFGYSVVESDCFFSCNNFAAKTDLSAHELGHNWGADHCPCSNPAYTMNATITSANRFHSEESIPEMEAYRNTRTCISQQDELRRIIITAADDEVNENGFLQLNVTADFLYGADQDVTAFVNWGLDRPVGFVSSAGVLTTFDVPGDLCLTLTAAFTFDNVMKTDQITIRVIDFDAPLHISVAEPPDGAIDARQPSDPQAQVALGWNAVTITLNGEVCSASPADFEVSEINGGAPVPQVVGVEQLSINTFLLALDPTIEPGAWTTVTHLPSGSSIMLGFLPGDVNGDATSDMSDVAALVDTLNGVGPSRPDWSTDLDRSGTTTPNDLITLIDLLNGSSAFIVWNGASLP